jgi:hypothetical protein
VTTQVLTQHRGSHSIDQLRFGAGRQHARTNGCSQLMILLPLGMAPISTRLPMLGKPVGLKIAYPAPDWQRLCGAPWKRTRSRGGARWRIESKSGAASTPQNIDINFAAAARERCRVTHPRGSGDLRQRRQSSRVRPLPRAALLGPTSGVASGPATRREPHLQQLPPIPAAQSSPRHR